MFRRLAPLVVAGLLLAACGSSDDASPTPTAPSSPVGSAPDDAASAGVPEPLRFSAPLLGGGDIEMAALAGRPVLLWFWAPW